MTKRKRSLLWVILIILISIGSFGFSKAPDPTLQDEFPNDDGWIEVTIYAEALMFDGFNAGEFFWLPAQALLPITNEAGSPYWRVHGDDAYTVYKSEGTFGGGIGTWDIILPVMWSVNAYLHPDCSVDFFLDVVTYPGVGIACAPIVGCITEPTPAETFPGPIFNLDTNETTMAVISWNEIPNTTGEITLFVESMTAGGACNVAQYLP